MGASFARRDISEGFWNRRNSFNYASRGHKSITLDLRSETGRELFFDLVRISDAYIENNAAGVVDRLFGGWDALSELNPRLVMASFPGFGLSGPYSHFKGYGATMEAVAGHTMLRGYRGESPAEVSATFHGDPNAGAHAAFAIIAALIGRERTGRGQFIEISQSEAVAHHVSYGFMDYSLNRRVQEAPGNRDPSMAPSGVFPARGEDAWIAIAVPSDAAFGALATELGLPGLADDPRFATVVARKRNEDALEALVAGATADDTPAEWMTRLQAVGRPGGDRLPPARHVRRPAVAGPRLLRRDRPPRHRPLPLPRRDGEVRARPPPTSKPPPRHSVSTTRRSCRASSASTTRATSSSSTTR